MQKEKTLAIDIGGTRIKMGVIEKGVVTASQTIDAHSQGLLQHRLPYIKAALDAMTQGNYSEFAGLGIALPCLVNTKTSRATEIYEKFVDAPAIDFSAWAQEAFGLPAVIEQDSKAALMGEAAYGVARGEKDVLLVILGTGVGTAVMAEGELIDSENHCAGVLGSHIRIEMNGRPCTCGGRGCLEAYTAGWALPGMVREQPDYAASPLSQASCIDFRALKEAALGSDPAACRVLNRIILALRNGLISLVHAFGPSLVVLSGGPVNMGECFLAPLLADIEKDLWGSCAHVRFRIADQPDASVLLGLDVLVRARKERERKQ